MCKTYSKLNKRDTGTVCEICSNLTKEITEQCVKFIQGQHQRH